MSSKIVATDSTVVFFMVSKLHLAIVVEFSHRVQTFCSWWTLERSHMILLQSSFVFSIHAEITLKERQ